MLKRTSGRVGLLFLYSLLFFIFVIVILLFALLALSQNRAQHQASVDPVDRVGLETAQSTMADPQHAVNLPSAIRSQTVKEV